MRQAQILCALCMLALVACNQDSPSEEQMKACESAAQLEPKDWAAIGKLCAAVPANSKRQGEAQALAEQATRELLRGLGQAQQKHVDDQAALRRRIDEAHRGILPPRGEPSTAPAPKPTADPAKSAPESAAASTHGQ